MSDTKPMPLYPFTISRLTNIISQMEGQVYGKSLEIAALGNWPILDLHVALGSGWVDHGGLRFEGKREADLINRFVEDFNAVTAPIRAKLASDLRQILAEHAAKMAADAVPRP